MVRHTDYVSRPAELLLHEHGVDAGQASSGEDFYVGYLFLPLDTEKLTKAGRVEVVQLPGMPLVDSPHFSLTAVW